MTSGVPSHGPWCRTRTFPMRCKLCGEGVFYFECNHGSRLLFDELGPPWPLHDHRNLSYDRKRDIAIGAVGKEATERYIATQMMTVRIDDTYVRRIQRAYRETLEKPHPPARQIYRQDPYEGLTTDETGIVRELIPEVDVYDRFGVPRTSLAAAALGELGTGAFAQMTVHTAALGERDDYSYTFLINRERLDVADVHRESLVRLRLRGVPVPERECVWVCDSIELIT